MAHNAVQLPFAIAGRLENIMGQLLHADTDAKRKEVQGFFDAMGLQGVPPIPTTEQDSERERLTVVLAYVENETILGAICATTPNAELDTAAAHGNSDVYSALFEEVLLIHALAVAPFSQGAGIGTSLLSAVEAAFIEDSSIRTVYGDTGQDPKVHDFYRRAGYEVLPLGEPLVLSLAGGSTSWEISFGSPDWHHIRKDLR